MLELKNLYVFLNDKEILKSITLKLKDGEFLTLLGPSGCGKSTLLKTVCGFTEHQSGNIIADGECIDNMPVQQRDMVLVFQDLRLFPNMCVWENVAFPLKMQNISKKERKEKAYSLLENVNLKGLEKRKINELSGGQQQRVALARAFAAKPKYLMLDEPFSSLDEELKVEMRELLLHLHHEHNLSIIFVTHDKQEAIMMSDKIAVMEQGEILQYGAPREVYENPINIRTAKYFGERNFINGTIKDNKFTAFGLSFGYTAHDEKYIASIPYNSIKINSNGLPFKINRIDYLGRNIKITVCNDSIQLVFYALPCNNYKVGDVVYISIDEKKINLFRMGQDN